ncbi:flotillin family protein [Lujinxingia vulgaris]|uniref:Flotillin family protein n=1 Tax=Lujinxingia vulgaris TaxID=2600176 RepID=A0A5C6XLG6_9DELT|nr:flotillin family protein [Lujinxingia vulgaris]TXD38457.1 flotillin family protein [Lujinxingia vulgaris]
MGIFALFGVILVLVVIAVIAATHLIEVCQPNEVLVFAGEKKAPGYTIVHSGRKIRNPLFHRVDRLDVTNMVIDLHVTNAYSKGGIPLSVKGVANVKVGSRSPLIDNAVERFLGMSRQQIIQIAKETLEGNLRGVLATLTPEEVNDDRIKFAQSLSEEAEHDLTRIGLELDTLNIQHVSDDQGYLDSIGRQQSATLLMESRIAEALNRAEASVLDAENQQKRATAKVNAQMEIAKAEAERRVIDAQTRGEAMVAEERAKVGAMVAKARANLDVQRARLEQVKRQLAADLIQPAQARKSELEAQAKANAASFIEDGKANVVALRELIDTWKSAGDSARPIFLLQQFDTILDSMLSTVQEIKIDKITVIDSQMQEVDRHGTAPMKAASGSEQIKQTLGMDLPRMLQGLAAMQESK